MGENATLSELVARGDLALSDGYRTRKDQLADDGIPILRVADVQDGLLVPSYTDHIRPVFRPKMGLKVSEPGDVLVTTKGTVGRIARVPDGFQEHAYSPQVCFLRALRPETIDARWLYQWARSPNFLAQIGVFKDQTDMAPYVSLRDLRRVRVTLPPLDEQRRIASVLGAFDDLIETNRRLAAEAVSLARAVLSDAGGERTRVGEWATLTRGLSYKGKGLCEREDPAGVPMLNLANFSREGWLKQSGLKFYSKDYRSRHVLRTYDLLIANTDLTQAREILGRGLLVPRNLNGAIYSHHTSVVRCDDPSLALVLWARLQSDEFRDRAMGFATGTTVTALPKEVLLDFEIRLPREPEVAANRARSLIEQAWGLEEEISDLTRTRDELLPLLMSGKVRVEDVKIPKGAA